MTTITAPTTAADGTYSPLIEVWTPEDARYWLDHPSAGQRNIAQTNVNLYRRRMASGQWRPEFHAPLCIMADGTLGNGHHRCTALAGLPDDTSIKMLVSRNVPMDVLPDMDTARPRSLAQAFGYEFPDKQADLKSIASLTGVLLATKPGDLPRVDVKADPIEAVEFATANFDRLVEVTTLAREVVNAASRARGVANITTVRSLGWLLWHTIDHPEAAPFWRAYSTSALDAKDPRARLLAYYGRHPFPRGAQSHQVTRQRMADLSGVWHAYLTGHLWKKWNGSKDTFIVPS